jgi:hypothetical protein
LRDELSATAVRICAYVGGLAVIAITVLWIFETPAIEAAHEPARTDWTTVARPFRAFALSVPEFPEPEPNYAIRRHVSGGGRKDVLSWGEAGAERSRLMIEIYRPGAEITHFDDPDSEVAARTAALGGPYPLEETADIDGKFGRISTFDFTAQVEGRPRQCLGFVRAFAEPRLQLAGWYCRGGLEVVDRSVLACALERLSLVMAASEPKVTELFAKAERQRKPCGQKAGPAQRLSNTTQHDWLSTGREPKLRGAVTAK